MMSSSHVSCLLRMWWLLCIGIPLISSRIQSVESLTAATPPPKNRRDVLMLGGMAAATAVSSIMVVVPSIANAVAAAEAETVDMAAIAAARKRVIDREPIDMNKINAARATTATPVPSKTSKTTRSIVPILDPPPTLSIRGGIGGKSTVKIPRVGYSFYKTPVDQAERCTNLALRAGIRHLDVATSYQSNPMIAKTLKRYLDVGLTSLDFGDEKPEILGRLDATSLAGELHARTTLGGGGGASSSSSSLSPAPLGSAGRRGRREGLFLSHKIANDEQQTQDATSVRRSVKAAIATLGCSYLDLVSIHSPLTDNARRLTSYQALLDLRDSGFVKSVGVCNYGVGALEEIAAAGLELPAVNQLELSPFNAHKDIVNWCDMNGIAIACSAWSKLSGASGPTEQWDVLSKLAQEKGMTKAQVLVRWALQKGYVCLPRSASASKVERLAIAENSYGGVNTSNNAKEEAGGRQPFILSSSEMRVLDALDVGYKAGKLGRIDGWTEADITGPEWDPTDFV